MKIMVSAYLDNNIGDDLMIYLLADKFKEHEFILYTNKSVIVNTFSKYANIIVKNVMEIKKDMNNIDVYLSIGGSIFNDLINWKGQIRRLNKIKLLLKLKIRKVKIVTISCNLESINSKIGLLLTKIEIKLNNLVSVRDSASYKKISKYKYNNVLCKADDIVYNLKKCEIQKLESKCLGISAYRSLKNNDNNMQNYILLAEISDDYINKTGNRVKLFAFDTENENDLSAAHHIYNLIQSKKDVEIISYLGNIEEFLREMTTCFRFIAIRFHSAILCDIYKIPFLPIIYSNKMNELLIDNDYNGIQFDINELNTKHHNAYEITDALITGKNLFWYPQKFNLISAKIHYDEFQKVLSK